MSAGRTCRSAARRVVASAAALALLASATTPAVAQQGGQAPVVAMLTLAEKQLPLPGGAWETVRNGANEMIKRPNDYWMNPVAYGPINNVVLAQRQSGRVAVFAEINVNGLPYPDGWGTAGDCNRTDLYATIVRYKSGWDVSCMFMGPVVIDEVARTKETWTALESYAKARKAELPTLWVSVGFRVANRHDVIDLRYYFSPAALGVPATAADADRWAPTEIEKRPEVLELIKDLAAWGAAMHQSVELGLRHQLKGGPFPTPRSVEVAQAVSDRADRLARLEALHKAGTLDQAEYDRQRQIIADEEKPKETVAWTLEQVAGYKAATYRVVVTTINAGIDYVFIGVPFAAGVLVVLQVIVNTTKFFFHEMMWQEWFGVAPIQRTEPRVIDFHYVTTKPLEGQPS